jgi:hypothetical protein
MRFKCLVITILVLLFSGCNRSAPETAVSEPTPLASPIPTSTPLSDFDEALRFVRNGQFTYIWVFTRKDGKPFDSGDSVILKARARQIVDFTMTGDKKKGVGGSNFPFEETDLVELKKRYVIEDWSSK